jgi:hypothetical protein
MSGSQAGDDDLSQNGNDTDRRRAAEQLEKEQRENAERERLQGLGPEQFQTETVARFQTLETTMNCMQQILQDMAKNMALEVTRKAEKARSQNLVGNGPGSGGQVSQERASSSGTGAPGSGPMVNAGWVDQGMNIPRQEGPGPGLMSRTGGDLSATGIPGIGVSQGTVSNPAPGAVNPVTPVAGPAVTQPAVPAITQLIPATAAAATVTPSAAINNKYFKVENIPAFHGDKAKNTFVSFQVFKSAYERFFAYNPCSPDMRGDVIRSRLTGRAAEWATEYLTNGLPTDQFEIEFEKIFKVTNTKDEALLLLRGLSLGDKEDVGSYFQRASSAGQSYGIVKEPRVLNDYIYDGLPMDVKMHVGQYKDRKTNEFQAKVQIAIDSHRLLKREREGLEGAKKGKEKKEEKKNPPAVVPGKRKVAEDQDEGQEAKMQKKDDDRRYAPACYNCGEKGHISLNCKGEETEKGREVRQRAREARQRRDQGPQTVAANYPFARTGNQQSSSSNSYNSRQREDTGGSGSQSRYPSGSSSRREERTEGRSSNSGNQDRDERKGRGSSQVSNWGKKTWGTKEKAETDEKRFNMGSILASVLPLRTPKPLSEIKCPKIEVRVDKNIVGAMVDTGAEVSVITEDLAKEMGLEIVDGNGVLTGVGGESMRIEGKTRVLLKYQNCQAYIYLQVLKMVCTAFILGTDFCHFFKMLIQFGDDRKCDSLRDNITTRREGDDTKIPEIPEVSKT